MDNDGFFEDLWRTTGGWIVASNANNNQQQPVVQPVVQSVVQPVVQPVEQLVISSPVEENNAGTNFAVRLVSVLVLLKIYL